QLADTRRCGNVAAAAEGAASRSLTASSVSSSSPSSSAACYRLGVASLLTLCVLTRSNVVTDATATTTPRATANKTSAVRCSLMDKPPRATQATAFKISRVGSVRYSQPVPGDCPSLHIDPDRGASILQHIY